MFKKITLSNGLRVILVPSQKDLAVTVLVMVAVGSKYESSEINGISHFLEHLFFKGTKKRPGTLEIAETLDRVGGSYNAFTSKEYTGYWAKVAKEHFGLALDWVSDIFLNSKLEGSEINRERGVILEEIKMRLDSPMHYLADLWEKLLYGNQPAGWETIGKRENILRLQRKDFTNYLKNHYTSSNTIVCLAGSFNQDTALAKVKKCFRDIGQLSPKDKLRVRENQREPRALRYFKKTDQSHLALGVRGFNLFDPRRYSQGILAVILGGNMSSRLFIKVRAKRGLAYYIHTSSDLYTDSGYLLTQAGVSHRDVKEVINLILKEYQTIRERGVSQQELQKAKDYLVGSLVLSLESSDAKASFLAGQELLTNKILTAKEQCAKINKVTADEVQKTAKEIFTPKNLNLALIGPHRNKRFKDCLKI